MLMSSVRAQAGLAADQVITEKDSAKPTDAYGRSKLAAERRPVRTRRMRHAQVLVLGLQLGLVASVVQEGPPTQTPALHLSGVVQPLPSSPDSVTSERLSPREALRLMQEESRLTPEQAEEYMRQVREERLAAEARRSA